MDFGLGKYLEMFEERFGKKATTALIIILTIALIALCFGIIYKNLILPIYHLILLIENVKSLQDLLKVQWISGIAALITSIGAGLLMSRIALHYYDCKAREITRDARNELNEISQARREVYDDFKRLGEFIKRAESLLKKDKPQ